MKKFAVLFDMDGVIVDTNPAHKIAILQFCDKYNKQLSDEELKAYADEKELLFRKIYEPDIKLLKGLKAFLDMLRRNNIPMAIGTSAPPENVDFVFTHTDIKKYFDVVLDERAVTIGKPNPEIYLKAANALKFDPADCIVIEDSLSGVEAGKRAGSKVIGITTTHTDAELSQADLTAADFSTLPLNDLTSLFKSSKYGT
jgi:HAD superfamily hydrolase (TIGR01509 family)